MPKKPLPPGHRELANEIASDFESCTKRTVDSKKATLGKRARLVLRLRRESPPKAKMAAAVKPIMDTYAAAYAS